MSFSMSGSDAFSYNRFNAFEKALLEGKGSKECGDNCEGCEKCEDEDKKSKKSSKKGAKPDYLDMDKDGNKEESMKDAIEDAGDLSEALRGKEYTKAMNKLKKDLGVEDDKKGDEDPKRGAGYVKAMSRLKKNLGVSEEVEHLEERLDEMPAGDVGHEIHKKAMKANQSAVDAVNKPKKKSDRPNLADVYGADKRRSKKKPEGYRPNLADVYGADKRRSKSIGESYAEVYEALRHRDAKTGEVTDKPEVGKTYYTDGPRAKSSVALRKEKEAAEKKALKKEEFESLEENRRAARAAGGYVDDSKKQTDPSKDGFTGISGSIKEIMKQNKEIEAAKKKATKKEELESTGLFTAEELEVVLEKMTAMDMVKQSLPKGALIDTKKQPKRQHWSKEHQRKDVDPKRYDKKND